MSHLVLVCGSRGFSGAHLVRAALEAFSPADTLILHGDARGADRLGASIAADMGFSVEAMPADWATHGRGAGYLRNVAMLDRQPDCVIAFWDGESRGTLHTITEARKRGIPVRVVKP